MEYLTEWPPPPKPESEPPEGDGRDGELKSEPDSLPAPKRLKHVHTGTSGSDGEREQQALAGSDPTAMAGPMLARWWKLKCRSEGPRHDEGQQLLLPCSSSNPNTLLHYIARLPEAKIFLELRVEQLKAYLAEDSGAGGLGSDDELHVAIASCYQRMGRYKQALNHVGQALVAGRAGSEDKQVKWLHHVLLRQNGIEERKMELKEKLQEIKVNALLHMPTPLQVERRAGEGLSFKEFFEEYALTHTPLIITGVVDHMTSMPWSLDYIKQAIGEKVAPLSRSVAGSLEWARLEPCGTSSVKAFIESLDGPQSELKYLFDWSLPLHCPELAKQLVIPKYFAADFLQRTRSRDSLYRNSWPSLFIAPAGISSELHVDAFGSNFWMALFKGKKRWVFFPPEDVGCLYPVLAAHSTDLAFEVDLAHPDLTAHPLLALSHPRECVLQPGELLFVPAGCPHRVENLEKSLAISANFVDRSNYERVLGELEVNALVDERAGELLSEMSSRSFITDMEMDQEDLVWGEYKK